MLNVRGSIRLWITAGILGGAMLMLHSVSHGQAIVPRQPLSELAYSFAGWKGVERPFSQHVIEAAGVSEYTNRFYVDQTNATILLYIGYYASQKTGDTIHSPKNCLPGAGWDPIRSGHTRIFIPGTGNIVVNEYVIQRDQDQDLVFYWYQGRGRVIASEYLSKFWMVADAISRNRTDGALVRLITPIGDGQESARARLENFVRIAFPHLHELIPN